MGGKERGDAGSPDQRIERIEHIGSRFRIEVAGRLVQQQQARRVGDRTGDGDALLLTAGKLGRVMAAALAKAHVVEQLRRPLRRNLLRQRADHLRHHHILQRRELGQEMVELVDKADVIAPDRRALIVAHGAAGLAAHIDLALIGTLQQAGQMQQRGLAGAGGRDKRHHLAAIQRQVGAFQDFKLAVGFVEDTGNTGKAQRRNGHGRALGWSCGGCGGSAGRAAHS